MIRREQAVLDLNAHHRALRRCHGCGSYARPSSEVEGRLLCEKCDEKARREQADGELRGEIEV
jgi:translation initiation factor 2 beta subunit (eIF-2beta)/eIF-5